MPVLLLLWATWFLLFDVLNSSRIYEYAQYLSNAQWAVIFIAAACFKAGSIFLRGCRTRQAATVASIALWATWLIIFLRSNYESHAVPTTLFFIYQGILSLQKISGCADDEWTEKK